MQDDATGKILAAQFFLSESTEGYFHLLQRLLRRFGVPTAFYGDRSGVFVRNDPHWSLEEELAGQRQPTQFGRALSQLGITFGRGVGMIFKDGVPMRKVAGDDIVEAFVKETEKLLAEGAAAKSDVRHELVSIT